MRIMRRIDSERPGSVDKDWRIVSEAVSYADAMQKQLVAISQNELNDVAGNNGGNGKLYDDINAVTFTKPDFSSLRTSVNTTLQGALSKQVTIRRKTAETKSVLEWYAVIDNKCQTATNAQVTALCADLGKTLVVPAGAEAILKDIDTRSADYAKVIDMGLCVSKEKAGQLLAAGGINPSARAETVDMATYLRAAKSLL